MSSTGVYGDAEGNEVDETFPCNPNTRRSKMRVLAEAAWTEAKVPLHIFRLPGIYGPGRGSLSKIRAKKFIVRKEGQKFSRIHVDDITNVIVASMAKPNVKSREKPAIYNVVDDEPAGSDVTDLYACNLMGLTPPPVLDFEVAAEKMTPMTRSFYKGSKTCSNRKIKEELNIKLIYPTYKEGFKADHKENKRLEALNNTIDKRILNFFLLALWSVFAFALDTGRRVRNLVISFLFIFSSPRSLGR